MSDTKPSTVNFAQLIGPPALLPGEDAAQYEALRAEVRKCFEPKSVLDEANVSDVTDKIWEAQRYKRFEVRILEGSRLSALAHLLLPLFQTNSFGAFVAAGEYFGRDSHKSKRIKNLMDEYNITEEMVYAKAASMECGKISYIERMISNREASRNGLLREHERRQRRAAKQSRKRGANDNETPGKKTATP